MEVIIQVERELLSGYGGVGLLRGSISGRGGAAVGFGAEDGLITRS
jgi:hypothetical protein